MLKNKEGITKVFTGVGVLVVAILIVWGALNVARLIPAALSGLASAAVTLTSVFVPSNNGIVLATSNNVVDVDKPFTLSWSHNTKEEGIYSLSYTCAGDLVFEVSTVDGQYIEIACDTSVEVVGKELKIVPTSSTSRFLDVSVKITFTNSDGVAISDEQVITVVNESSTNSRDTTDTTDTTTVVTPGDRTDIIVPISGSNGYSDPNGKIDLAARMISTGVVNIDTNEYTATNNITSRDRVGARFEIENLGTKASGVWNFTAVLPTQTIYFYNSESQRSLNPGDKIEFTIGFDGVKTKDTELVINVDPGQNIGEVNEVNNILRHPIEITVVE